MKKICKVILAAAAIAALAVPAMAADKLIVKPATGTTNVLTVTDDGKLGVNKSVPVYPVSVATVGGVNSSQLHFNAAGNDGGGWLTSVADNNFWISSGATYVNDQWIQKSADTKAVFFGSGAAGFRAFMSNGGTVGQPLSGMIQALLVNYTGDMELYGQLRLNVAATPTAQPACAANKRGYIWMTKGAAGVKDALQVCAKDAAEAYAWRTIY